MSYSTILKRCFSVILLALTSCETLFFTAVPSSNNAAVFDAMWNNVNEKYSMFEFKNIDWHTIRTTYRDLAIAAKTDEELFGVLSLALKELRDDHVNIFTKFNRSAADNFYFDSASFDYTLVRTKYLQGTEWNTRPLVHALIRRDGKVYGYIRYSSFAQSLSEETINYVLRRFREANADGIILDIRDNGGGASLNGMRLAAHFVQSPAFVMLEMRKFGPGRKDFDAPFKVMIEPSKQGERWTEKRIALLTNRKCYSATSYFAAWMKAPELNHVRLIGDHTGGGSGSPVDAQLPNGWTYRFSTTKAFIPPGRVSMETALRLAPNRNHEFDKEFGYNFEEGVPVDIFVQLQLANRNQDAIIERAMEYISTGR